MSVGIGIVEIVVLLVACGAVIAAVRKPSWVTLLAAPFGLLVLLSIGTVTWSLAAPRIVSYVPPEPVENWDHLQLLDRSDWQSEQAGWVMQNQDRSGRATFSRLNGIVLGAPLLLGAVACAIVLTLKRKWIAQHANVVLPLVAVGFAGVLAIGGAALFFVRIEDREDVVRATRRAELRAMEEAFRDESARTKEAQMQLGVEQLEQFVVHHGSSYTEGARVSSSGPESLDVRDDAEVTTEESVASSEETAANPESETTVAVTELPEWARGETVDWRKLLDGVRQNTVVLVSDQWSSVQESEIQLEAMAARALQQQLLMDRGSYRWQPSKDFVHQSGAIQQRFVEQTSLKVGEFDTPMYRSYWQVAATPYVSSLAQKEWKAAAVEERLTLLGAAAAVLTLLFAGGAAGLRFDSATGGRYRRRMAAAVVAVGALAAGTAALFVA